MSTKRRKVLKDIPTVDRPREKLIKYGPEKLDLAELLAILFGSGTRQENAITLAKRIIRTVGSDALPQARADELRKLPGLGPAKACEIVACFELGKRLLKEKKTNIFLTPHDIWETLRDIRKSKKEHFIIFFLDSRSQEIKRELISIGTVNKTVIHPREVFEPAVRYTAANIILAHNHPTGDPEPSEEDILLTSRLVEAGDLMGIEVLDHVIVTQTNYVSMKEYGLM